ncbi:MAG: NAD(P)-binding domain-containing protein [Micromonosporaceae bacterium]|nr:NAD(P)-binding domain-containing protein [Micromonosporaceae bacterium]
MREAVDVAIVGAGPYGLSVAAHLRALGLSLRTFGQPMSLWRGMPNGMFLKSQPFASNLSDPAGAYTLEAFCRATNKPYVSYGRPLALETFIEYGMWFQRQQVPDLEETLVTHIDRVDGRFAMLLSNGETAYARAVVIATGVEHFAHLPEPFATLPRQLCTHTSAHANLGAFAGRDITIIGGGQSALESAALAHEQGATVRVVVRQPKLRWNGAPLPPDRPMLRKLREPEAGLGSGWSTWFYSTQQGLFTYLPAGKRAKIARTALGPAGAHWLRPRVENQFPVLLGHTVAAIDGVEGAVHLRLRDRRGHEVSLRTEHVIAATGYRTDLSRLTFLDSGLRTQLRTIGTTPRLGRDFQSSVPGLYFVGPAAASTFGPAMRFVYGADFAARRLADRISRSIDRHTAPTRKVAV